MENENTDKNLASLVKRIRFKFLPFDEALAFERLKERVKEPLVISYTPKSSPVWKYVSIAASVACLLVTGLYLMEIRTGHELTYYETTAVPDAKTKVVLPDSSVVWLNANACLRYPREFTGQTREVSISGEAFFDIRKDAQKPFIVQTSKIGIRVLGTTFNVDAQADKTEITLLTGKIELYKNDHPSTSLRTLSPGEQAVYTSGDERLQVSAIRPASANSWVTGRFVFRDSTLEEIMKELARAFHVKIHIENETLRHQTFNADFVGQETLDEILSIMQITARYEIEKRKGEIYLK